MFEQAACCGISVLVATLVAVLLRVLVGSDGGDGGGDAWCANPACTTGACTNDNGEVVCDAYDDA